MSIRKCKACGEIFGPKVDTCPACGAKYERFHSQTSTHRERKPSEPCSLCSIEAICRVRMNHGWVNLCMAHYKTYWTPEHIAENLTAPSQSSDFVRETRKIYEQSAHYARTHK